jgi:hypothetical protein
MIQKGVILHPFSKFCDLLENYLIIEMSVVARAAINIENYVKINIESK